MIGMIGVLLTVVIGTGPGPVVSLPIPGFQPDTAWSAAAWVRLTEEPSISPDTLTLDGAVEIALERNPAIAAARWDLEASREKRNAEAASRWPALSVSGSLSQYATDQRLSPPTKLGEPLVFTDQAGTAGLVLNLPVFVGGQLTNQIQAATLMSEAAAHRLEGTRQQTVFNVSSVFHSILQQERVVESIEFSLQAMEAHGTVVSQMMAAGKAARVDVLRVEVRLADLRQRLVSEQNKLAVEKKTLAYLLRLEGGEPLPELAGTLTLVPFETVEVDEGVAEAMGNRPDYQAAKSALDAQARRVRAAGAARWPALYLRGSYEERWAINPHGQPSGSDPSRALGSIGLVIGLPVFDGGRISARTGEERAKLEATRERLVDLEMQIRLQVEEALLGIGSSRARVEATESSTEQAEETLRIEQEKYRLGKGSLTDVLDAQSELLGAQTAYYGALAGYNMAIARYRLMAGEKRCK